MRARTAALGGALALLCALMAPGGQAVAASAGAPVAEAALAEAAPVTAGAAVAGAPARHEVVTWGASAQHVGTGVADRAFRLVVRTSAGGDNLRVRLSNAFGDRPVTFDQVWAGRQKTGAELVRGSNRPLTFDGARSVTVPAGEWVYSDPLPGKLPAGTNLVVSVHSPDAAGPMTGHGMAMQTSYYTEGDHTAEESATHWAGRTGSWFYLDAVTVRTSSSIGAVVTLGDSITDGWQSSTDLNRRWPDYLARRLSTSTATTVEGVANEGISGNKVLADGAGVSALNRLDRDVLSHPGVRTVFLFQGINDIKAHTGVTADDLIAGYREIIDRAHAAGKCVVGATVGPYKGWYEWDEAGEAVRQEVNAFIRTSGAFDAVADFDRALRSPYDQQRMLPFLDNGDHVHPNDKGMQAMADAVDPASLDCA